MGNIQYADGMRQLAKKLGMEKIKASPSVLVGGMADLWLAEKDIEIMRIAMRSSCASTLLTLISEMRGTEQDYQKQKKMLMDEAYLGDVPAHRVLVGLWALVGKDAEHRCVDSGKQTVDNRQQETWRETERTRNQETERPREQEIERGGHEERHTQQSRQEKWGHGAGYYVLMWVSEFLAVMLISCLIMEVLFSNGFGGGAGYSILLQIAAAVVCYILAHVLDKKDKWHMNRSQTTFLAAGKVLSKGKGPWISFYLKLISWCAMVVLSIAAGDQSHNDLLFTVCTCSLAVTASADILYDYCVHLYLDEIGAVPGDLKK